MKPGCIGTVIALFFLTTVMSCSSELRPEQYVRYMEANAGKRGKKISRNGIDARIAYIPVEYYAALAVQNDTTLPIDSALKRYNNSIFFVLSVKAAADSVSMSPLLARNGFAGFKESVERNTFGREQDVFLLNGGDTVKTVSIKYERNWGVGNDDSFLLGFSQKELNAKLGNYRLFIREMTPELGTLDIKVSELMKNTKRLKG